MTIGLALYNFFSSFGLLAYHATSVPTDQDAPDFPYLTYGTVFDDFASEAPISASVWYRGESWAEPNAKAQQIGKAIGKGGVMLPCDGGALWLKKGNPFAQPMGDNNDDKIKRILFNLTVEFLTVD